jgi:hypothetical protein
MNKPEVRFAARPASFSMVSSISSRMAVCSGMIRPRWGASWLFVKQPVAPVQPLVLKFFLDTD